MNSPNTPNNPSPLIPQGSLLEKNAGRSRVKFAFFCVVGVHVAGLMVLLMQGCKRDPAPPPIPEPLPPAIENTNPPPIDPALPPAGGTSNIPPQVPVEPPPVPPPAPVATKYVVQPGDSFSTIAKKYPGVTPKMIQDANPKVNPLKLQLKQELEIPAPVVKAEPPPGGTGTGTGTGPGPTVTPSGQTIYTVKSGDALEKIAKQFGTSTKAIQTLNRLPDTKIKVGQKLKIPVKAPPPAPVP